jgi:SAM-dependent methyltransferase
MKKRGWSPHGFDVFAGAGVLCPGADVRTAPVFGRHLFEGRFGAVLCREVIEHVEGWRQLLHECFWSLEPGGLFQVQTPIPQAELAPGHPYGRVHLHIFTPVALEMALRTQGFVVVDRWDWKNGVAFLCQRP